MRRDPSTQDYNGLRTRVAGILEEGKNRAARAVERELVRTYWQVGDVLHRHLLANQDRAGYGEQLVVQLSNDLEIRKQRLYEMLKFRRLFPKVRAIGLLGWTHYVAVLGLSSEEERSYYLAQAEALGWTTRELAAAVKAQAFSEARAPEAIQKAEERGSRGAGGRKLQPKRGELYTYRVAEPDEPGEDGVVLDLGFEVQHEPEVETAQTATPGEVVTVSRVGKHPGRYEIEKAAGTRAKLYTYKAKVLRVVDGDTLWVRIDLGFKIKIRQKLRLRGIDTPEMNTAEGRRARDYVKAVLAGVPWVVVTTTRPDKYDRYLSDVYYPKSEEAARTEDAESAEKTRDNNDAEPKVILPQRRRGAERGENQTARQGGATPEEVARSGRYLNWEMVEKGMARRYSGQ